MQSEYREKLIAKVDHFRKILVSHATDGEYKFQPQDYVNIRREFMADPQLKNYLPEFIKNCRDLPEFWSFIKMKFAHYYERRLFIQEQFHPLYRAVEEELQFGSPSDAVHSILLNNVGSSQVQAAWQKAIERRSSDPEGAITAARTLLETVCKHILEEAGVVFDDSWDLPKLYGKAAEQMNLAPAQHDEPIFKQILGGTQAVVNGLAAIRNRLGDAHGKGSRSVRPSPRHAEFGVNLAGAVSVFLIRTWEERVKVQPANNR